MLKSVLLNVTFLFLLLINFSVLFAQENYLYENISVADGLSSSSFNILNSIYQDRFGFLWFGTVDGLNRYDGYNFKVYKNIPGDSSSIPSSNIYNINEDADGNLWVASPNHMSILDRKTNTFINYNLDRGSSTTQQDIQIIKSLCDSKGNFWISTLGRSVQKWNKKADKWELIPLYLQVEGVDSLVKSENNGTAAITELRNGNILASEFSRGIYYYNEKSEAFERFKFSENADLTGIVEIYEDKGGKIWFGGRNKFLEYNPLTQNINQKDDWKKFKATSQYDVFLFDLNEMDDGTFLLCSMPFGLMKFNPLTGIFDKVEVGGELATRGIGSFAVSKLVDRFGVYWIGLADNGILKFDPNRRPFTFYALEKEALNQSNRAITNSIKLNKYNSKEILISTSRKGFFKFNLDNKSIQKINVPVNAIYSDSSNLYQFAFDEDNKIWFASTLYNITYYDLISGKTESFPILNNDMQTGTNESITGVEYFPSNKLFISTNVGGFILDTKTKKLENFPSVMNRKYDENLLNEFRNIISKQKPIASLTKAGEASNLSKEFTLKEEKNLLVVCLGEGNYPNGIFDSGELQDDKGNPVWSMNNLDNTFNDGGGFKNRLQINVLNLKPGDYQLKFSTDVGHSYGNFNVAPPEDSTWYGIQVIELDNQLADKLKKQIENEIKNKSFPSVFGVNFAVKSKKYPNNLWIGANDRGIIRYNTGTKNSEQYFLDNIKNSQVTTREIFEDNKGNLWITFNPSGFYRFNPSTEEFISNATIPDLPITGINGMIEDFQGSFWISSTGGISKLTHHKDGSWSTSMFDSKDGVQGGFGSGSLITDDGEIIFGSYNGITTFYPGSENTSEPIPIISNIKISDVSVLNKESTYKLDKSIFEEVELDLSYDQNDVSFEFASLHYSRPSKNRVSYMLDGFNDHWIFTDKNFASFTNLEPGEYTLRIKAYSGFGVPGKEERTLRINVAPPWYRTTTAYISYFVLFIGFVFGIDRFQRHRLLTKEREKQKIQEAELRAIAAEAQAKAVEAENERKSKELEEARQLQLSMLPKKLPDLPHLDIAVFMQTATEVGGDYYDFHVGMDGTLTVVVGDATGHGMRAGTMVTAAKSLFSTHAANPDILFTFSEISRCLKYMDMHLLTMCMAVMKIKENKMIMSSAGMPPTLLFREKTKQLEEITLKGMPLGAVEKFPYSIKETTLFPGDTLLLMSDGFPELFNNKREMFGYDKVQTEFHKVAEKSPEDIIERLKSSASSWTENSDPNDDITFVVIKVK